MNVTHALSSNDIHWGDRVDDPRALPSFRQRLSGCWLSFPCRAWVEGGVWERGRWAEVRQGDSRSRENGEERSSWQKPTKPSFWDTRACALAAPTRRWSSWRSSPGLEPSARRDQGGREGGGQEGDGVGTWWSAAARRRRPAWRRSRWCNALESPCRSLSISVKRTKKTMWVSGHKKTELFCPMTSWTPCCWFGVLWHSINRDTWRSLKTHITSSSLKYSSFAYNFTKKKTINLFP